MNKHIKFFTISVATISLASLTGIAMAGAGQHSHHKGGKFMSFFDSNQDNIVTMDELNAASKSRFAKMDTNGDNTVSRDEFDNRIKQRRQEHQELAYKTVDENNDGNISKAEFASHKQKQADRQFQNMDSNNDGVISPGEFATGKHQRNGKKYQHQYGKRIFAKLDANSDGKITQDESLTAWTNWFKRVDENGDQIVTLEEVQKFRSNNMKDH